MNRFDVQVLGAGIVGKSLALSLARLGLQVALRPQAAARPRDVADVRAYALNAASVALLEGLRVWGGPTAAASTPVLDMQVRGDAAGAGIDFSAWEQRVGALAWITDAQVLEQELDTAVRFAPHICVVDASSFDADTDAPLTALCEGAASARRAMLGVEFERKPYAHQAIAARLAASDAHRGIARQWFRSPDVLALLPFDAPEPGRSHALVWSMPDAQAGELMAADPSVFETRLNDATGGAAGALTLASPRAAWPLSLARASAWCGPGWALLGDAAHVVHPLAGQGLNMGLADVAALTRVIAERESWRGLGDPRLLRRYARERASPTWAMGRVTDGLLELFSHEAVPVRELRNRGLTLVNRLAPLKRWLTDQAVHSS